MGLKIKSLQARRPDAGNAVKDGAPTWPIPSQPGGKSYLSDDLPSRGKGGSVMLRPQPPAPAGQAMFS